MLTQVCLCFWHGMGCKVVKKYHHLAAICSGCPLTLAAMVANKHCSHNKSSMWLWWCTRMIVNNNMHNASCAKEQARGSQGGKRVVHLGIRLNVETLQWRFNHCHALVCIHAHLQCSQLCSLCDDFVNVCQLIQLMTNGTAKPCNASPKYPTAPTLVQFSTSQWHVMQLLYKCDESRSPSQHISKSGMPWGPENQETKIRPDLRV